MCSAVKVIVTCNNCGKRISTNSRDIKPCKCGSVDMAVDDQWELYLNKYAEGRKKTWDIKHKRA